MSKDRITIKTVVELPGETVWNYWTEPEHIVKWNNASADWHTTASENDLRAGGRFLSRMEAKDGSFGFDFSGVYDEIIEHERITYTLDDDRKVEISFQDKDGKTEITEIFEAEGSNTLELQKTGWQAILDNFRNYAEEENRRNP